MYKKNNSGVITITDTKINYRILITKTIVCHINKNRPIEQSQRHKY